MIGRKIIRIRQQLKSFMKRRPDQHYTFSKGCGVLLFFSESWIGKDKEVLRYF